MSTYVISDIHGCYDQFIMMLDLIALKDEDTLILAGDYIDRGSQNLEMLEYLMNLPQNVIALMGNHDFNFVSYVNDMIVRNQKMHLDDKSIAQTQRIYSSCTARYSFDYYQTIYKLIEYEDISLSELVRWSNQIEQLPYMHSVMIHGQEYIIVHAGYYDEIETAYEWQYATHKSFCLNIREQGWLRGGKDNTTVIFGHTPTIFPEFETYNQGRIKHLESRYRDCDFYDIDCGIVYREDCLDAKLGCLRLEDKKEFYVE